MATDLLIIPDKKTLHLVAATSFDQEAINGLRFEKHYKAKLTLASHRSVIQNRYYWGGVLQTAVDNQEFYLATKPLHIFIKQRLGYIDKVVFHDGKVHIEVESTSFGSMDPEDFRTYLDAAILLICTEVIPGLDPTLLKANAAQRTGITYSQACSISGDTDIAEGGLETHQRASNEVAG